MVLLTLNHDTAICVAGADFYRSVAATCIVKEQISDIEGSMVYVLLLTTHFVGKECIAFNKRISSVNVHFYFFGQLLFCFYLPKGKIWIRTYRTVSSIFRYVAARMRGLFQIDGNQIRSDTKSNPILLRVWIPLPNRKLSLLAV